jgi:Ni2+-binding GTPase involved in maturation of urease and hydrogenase
MMNETKLLILGGFLGAGKTTLLRDLYIRLSERGLLVGLITNDQAPGLVDTALLSKTSSDVIEVSGSCFCCNFEGFVDAIREVSSDAPPDVIIAEAVGSCTDLEATVVAPFKDQYEGSNLQMLPLSVIVDANILMALLEKKPLSIHPSVLYVLSKQLEEADFILISKSDLITGQRSKTLRQKAQQTWPWAHIHNISAKFGYGVDSFWSALTGDTPSEPHWPEVDYDLYAEGEALLGWLNSRILLSSEGIQDWNLFCYAFLESLNHLFNRKNAMIGHIKVFLETSEAHLHANVTSVEGSLSIDGESCRSKAASMTLNARVQLEPEILKEDIVGTLQETSRTFLIEPVFETLSCFSPARPKPTYRYKKGD